jgi:hemolysin activation/secretion protein
VNVEDLDRALLLISDLPGVIATGRLSPGDNHAETDLTLVVQDAALVDGNVTVDNAGARFTGVSRVIADASLNGRLGVGDRADALLLYSEGSEYMRLGYSLPFSRHGWRAGVNASHLSYNVLTPEFSALDAHGTSTAAGIEVSYPLLRSRLKNLYLGFDAGEKRFDNKSAGQTSTRYSVQAATLGAYGNLFDSFFGGGANSASIALVQGSVDLSGSPNEAADALTTRAAGSFQKLRFSASRLQAITDHVALFASLDGQLASKNLDSSQKLYLGGSQGVRAYPENEAGGAEGLLLNLEARANVADIFTVTAFLDWGSVRVNKDNDIPGAVAHNSIDLKGAGLSVGWVASFGLHLQATAAQRIGSNPNSTSNGDDQDGSLVKSRVWLQAGMPF